MGRIDACIMVFGVALIIGAMTFSVLDVLEARREKPLRHCQCECAMERPAGVERGE